MPTTSLPSISKLIATAWKHARPNYWKLAGIALIGNLLVLPFTLFVLFNSKAPFSNATPDSIGTLFPVILLYCIVTVFFQLWSQMALKKCIVQSNKIKIFKSYKEAFKLLPGFLWIYFLQLLVAIPAFICFIVPSFIILINIWFAKWFVVTGEARGLTALAESRELSRGLFWKTTLRCLAPILLIWVVSLVINVYLPQHSIWSSETTKVITNILSPAFYILVTPLITQYDYELFLALKKHGAKKNPKKQIEKYKVLSIIGATLFMLYILMAILSIILMIFVSTIQPEGTIEKPAYERSES